MSVANAPPAAVEGVPPDAPPRAPRRSPLALAFKGAVLVAALFIMAAAYGQLRGQWDEALRRARGLHPRWELVAAASLLVLGAYAVLIETWRRVLATMGGALGFNSAARVWFVSNLARYIPGALWQMGALGKMAYDRGVDPIAAAGAAVVMTIVNVLTGLAIAFAAGAGGLGRRGWLAVALGIAALALVPVVSPRLARVASRLRGRDVSLPSLTPGALWLAAFGNAAAWLLYGLGFWALALGTAGPAAPLTSYVAVYAAAYLAGFLALAPPAGVGVAEGAMVAAFAALGLGPASAVVVLAVVSRLWRTVLETVPGLVYLALPSRRAPRGG